MTQEERKAVCPVQKRPNSICDVKRGQTSFWSPSALQTPLLLISHLMRCRGSAWGAGLGWLLVRTSKVKTRWFPSLRGARKGRERLPSSPVLCSSSASPSSPPSERDGPRDPALAREPQHGARSRLPTRVRPERAVTHRWEQVARGGRAAERVEPLSGPETFCTSRSRFKSPA